MAQRKSTPEEDLQAEMLLKEADEELRKEKFEALWQEWGQTLIGIAVMLVLGTALGVGWKNWRHSVNSAQTENMIIAQEQGVFGLSLARNQGLEGEHLGLANILVAGQLTAENDDNEGTSTLVQTMMEDASNAGLPNEWNAVPAWASLRIEAKNAEDSGAKTAIADRMVTLADDNDNPYAPAILVEAATLYGENGNPSKALELLETAQSHPLSQNAGGLSQLIEQLTHLYTVDLGMKNEGGQS